MQSRRKVVSTNAVGKYHSTDIWEFAMHCRSCPNMLIVQTDPKGCDYVFTEGAQRIVTVAKQFRTENATEGKVVDTKLAKDKLFNPLIRLEGKVGDEEIRRQEMPRIAQILQMREKFKDDYDANALMRKKFREEKKETSDKLPYMDFPVKMEELDDFDMVRRSH